MPTLYEIAAEAFATQTDTADQPTMDARAALEDARALLQMVKETAEHYSMWAHRSGMTAMLERMTPAQQTLVTQMLAVLGGVWAQTSPYPFPEMPLEAVPVPVETEPVETPTDES